MLQGLGRACRTDSIPDPRAFLPAWVHPRGSAPVPDRNAA
jgi:hypothetical protein